MSDDLPMHDTRDRFCKHSKPDRAYPGYRCRVCRCGYESPLLGACICGDAANHEPGGKFASVVALSGVAGNPEGSTE